LMVDLFTAAQWVRIADLHAFFSYPSPISGEQVMGTELIKPYVV